MDVAPGGYRYGIVLAVAGAIAVVIHPAVAAALFALAAGAVWFHRDPERAIPPSGIVAPADGTVKVVREEGSGSAETATAATDTDDRLLVGTFMNVHDVHVNRAPLSGTVVDVEHSPGAHRPAFSKASERNERVRIDLETELGPARVTLIAGAFARRIHPYVAVGDEVARGERIGHISFGSRADVRFPPGIERADLAVEQGESVTAGESVLLDGVDGASDE